MESTSSWYTIYVLWSKIWPNLAMAYPHHISRYRCCDPRFDQIWPKKWKNLSEKWVRLEEKMVLLLQNFGHGLSSSYSGVMPGKSQNAVLQLYSIILLCAVSKLKPKQYKLLQKWHQSTKIFFNVQPNNFPRFPFTELSRVLFCKQSLVNI